MRCKPGGKPEAEKPQGMAESPSGLDVARAEVKALRAAMGKVSVNHASVSYLWKLGLGDTSSKSQPGSASPAYAVPLGNLKKWGLGVWGLFLHAFTNLMLVSLFSVN